MFSNNLNENDILDSRFLDKSYERAMELTEEVAAYLDMEKKNSHTAALGDSNNITYASESMRLSASLMQVMSWFLVQKGVASGEISKEQATEKKFRLGGEKICLAKVDASKGELPTELLSYLQQTRALYRQVARMDKMVYGGEGAVNPVHDLQSKIQDEDV